MPRAVHRLDMLGTYDETSRSKLPFAVSSTLCSGVNQPGSTIPVVFAATMSPSPLQPRRRNHGRGMHAWWHRAVRTTTADGHSSTMGTGQSAHRGAVLVHRA